MSASSVKYLGRPGIDPAVDVQPVPFLAPFRAGEVRIIDDQTAAVAAVTRRDAVNLYGVADGADDPVPDGQTFAEFVFGQMNVNRKRPLFEITPIANKEAEKTRQAAHADLREGVARLSPVASQPDLGGAGATAAPDTPPANATGETPASAATPRPRTQKVGGKK